MAIRAAHLDDLPELTNLFEAYRTFYQMEPDRDTAQHFLRQRLVRGESRIFVAEHAGHLAGFVQLYPIFSSTQLKRLWLLNDLFVAPASRGQGLSIALIDRAKNLARETQAAGLLLETAKDNEIGNQLYPRAGFTLDAAHNFYNWSVE